MMMIKRGNIYGTDYEIDLEGFARFFMIEAKDKDTAEKIAQGLLKSVRRQEPFIVDKDYIRYDTYDSGIRNKGNGFACYNVVFEAVKQE